ncbi:retrovirus-related pol polyprotein from transposon TNT 1-94 [Tanacetum coccineum]|uniref:Retrovirus-related pol polyprotein from transposon TNT 1-94 n=1 Tax=Tanacetum coccineum TaxID=301880 RepID=A0ABQ5GTA6_9ASTR
MKEQWILNKKSHQRDKEMQKNLGTKPSKYFKKLYKPTNNNLRTSSNSKNKTEDTTPRYNNDNQSRQFGNQRTMTVAGVRESSMKSGCATAWIQSAIEQPIRNWQCMYLIIKSKVKECECLAQKLSKQTESVNKEVHNNLLKSFSKLEKHSISLELALQQCKEQMKNNSVCKENGSNVFRKEREQYHEIQDLKAQMQDKNIAISELKKLIEKCKGKSVETQFDKPSVVRQPNAQRIPKPSNLPQNRKQAEIHSNVLKPGMHRIATSTKQNREPQLPHASRNTNPHVSKSTGVTHPTSVSRPQLKSYQVKDKVVPNISQVKFTKKEVEDHHRISSISKKIKSVTVCNNTTNSRTSNVNAVCAECGKCVFNSNHDACVSRYLNVMNARTKKPNVVPIGDSKPKRKANKSVATTHKKTVASDTTIQKPKSYFKELYENTNKAWKWWIEKKCPSEYKWTQTTPSRPNLKWKPTGRIFSNVRFRWIPTGKLFNSCTGKVDSEPTHVSIVDIPHIHASKQTLGLSAGISFNGQKQQRIDLNADALYNEKQENLRVWLLKLLISKKPVPECNRGSDLYTISLQETTSSTPICFMAKASPTQAWLWHRRLSHLNFDYITLLSKKDIVTGLPKLTYVKDQLCSSCEMSKAKRSTFKSKDCSKFQRKAEFLHMELVWASFLKDKWRLLKITLQALVLNVKMTSVHINSGLVLNQMTSDHNRSELGIQDHINEQSGSKLVPKVVPLAMLRTTGK